MLVRLNVLYEHKNYVDYSLIDILRSVSMYNRDVIISRLWMVRDLELYPYVFDATTPDLQQMFPEMTGADGDFCIVSGERLMERAALINYFKCGYFLRLISRDSPVELQPEYRLRFGPAAFQASNADFEIRCTECFPHELVTNDDRLVEYLQSQFRETEVEI